LTKKRVNIKKNIVKNSLENTANAQLIPLSRIIGRCRPLLNLTVLGIFTAKHEFAVLYGRGTTCHAGAGRALKVRGGVVTRRCA